MKDWKVGTRISIGFGIVVAIAIALGVFAYGKVGYIDEAVLHVTNDSLPSVYFVGRVESNTQRQLGLVLQHATSSDQQEMARLETQIMESRTANNALVGEYEKLIASDAERALYETFKSSRAAF